MLCGLSFPKETMQVAEGWFTASQTLDSARSPLASRVLLSSSGKAASSQDILRPASRQVFQDPPRDLLSTEICVSILMWFMVSDCNTVVRVSQGQVQWERKRVSFIHIPAKSHSSV